MPERNLSDYLTRIGLAEAPCADSAGLTRWLAAHRQAIPFENLDIPLGRGIAIDAPSVFAKLVHRGRGGYCFEQNRLLSDMLSLAGFTNLPLLGRVLLGVPPELVPPRTHMLLLVRIDGQDWIADGGFGGSFVPPLPLVDGANATTPDGATHRLRRTGDATGEWLLERSGPIEGTDGRMAHSGEWQPQYAFDLAPVAQDDLEQCNHWTATRPGQRFTTLHVVSRVLPDGFASLTECELAIYRGGESDKRTVAGPDDYAQVLEEVFGLSLPVIELASLRLFA
jgi:N-hydroxyarylamine O-acetyltransferase